MGQTGLKALLIAGVALMGMPAFAADKELKIYNWSDYIGETTIADFEAETGIKVVYDVYDSSETAEARLMAGSSGYDLVLYAGQFAGRMIEAGIFQPLDKSKIPNWSHYDEAILERFAEADPGNQYGAPYMWGTTGFAYNVDKVAELAPDAPLDSAAVLFDPQYADKLSKCGISWLDSPTDVLPMMLAYLGLDPNSEEAADYAKVQALAKPVRSSVTSFTNEQYLNALPNGDLCVAMSWSGDYATAAARAEEAGLEVDLAYSVPKEGAGIWFDAFFIPSDAQNVEAAHQFLDYLARPEVIAAITDYTYYANANKDATALIDPAVAEDPAIYPTPEVMDKLFGVHPLSPAGERIRTRTWSAIKTGE